MRPARRPFSRRRQRLSLGGKRHRRFFIGSGQTENNPGDVVLRGRWKPARGFERLLEKCCHGGQFLQ
jgi:hypothetical protein